MLPAATRRDEAVSGPMPKALTRAGRCRSGESFKFGLQVLDFLAELTVTTSKRTKCVLGPLRLDCPDDRGGSFRIV